MRTENWSWIHQGECHCQSHMLWLISGPENLRGVSSGKINQIESWAAYFDWYLWCNQQKQFWVTYLNFSVQTLMIGEEFWSCEWVHAGTQKIKQICAARIHVYFECLSITRKTWVPHGIREEKTEHRSSQSRKSRHAFSL